MDSKIYKNGNLCLVIEQDCFNCGERDWVVDEILNDKAIFRCKKCDSMIRLTLRIGDMRAETIAKEIINDINEGIDSTY